MTTQIPDSLTLDGRKWEIECWDKSIGCIPSNQSLGFETISPGTNNWAGRIDHFLVLHDKLMLFKVEVTLHPENKGVLPFGARREIVVRYEQLTHWGKDGMKMIERPREYEYLVYEDLVIPYTGTVTISYPYFDYWEVPWPIQDEDEETTMRAAVTFKDGVMERWRDLPVDD